MPQCWVCLHTVSEHGSPAFNRVSTARVARLGSTPRVTRARGAATPLASACAAPARGRSSTVEFSQLRFINFNGSRVYNMAWHLPSFEIDFQRSRTTIALLNIPNSKCRDYNRQIRSPCVPCYSRALLTAEVLAQVQCGPPNVVPLRIVGPQTLQSKRV